MRSFVYLLAQVIWGFPQTLAGAVVFLANRRRPHCRFHGAVVTTWASHKALSLGPFVFVGGPAEGADPLEGVDRRLLVHEYGHTVQSLILGPLYLLVIGLPSAIWLNAPAFSRKRRLEERSYYAFYTERSANLLGELVTREPSIGLALID